MYMCTIDNTYVHAKICSARPPPLRVLWIGVGTNAKTICRVCWARDSAKCRLSMFVRFLGWVLSLRRHSLVQFFRYFYFHSWVYGKKNYKFRMRHKKREWRYSNWDPRNCWSWDECNFAMSHYTDIARMNIASATTTHGYGEGIWPGTLARKIRPNSANCQATWCSSGKATCGLWSP